MKVFYSVSATKLCSLVGLILLYCVATTAQAGGCMMRYPTNSTDGIFSSSGNYEAGGQFVPAVWHENNTFGPNALMADNTSIYTYQANNCTGLTGPLRSKILHMVYEPGPGAILDGNGYITPSTNVPGVGFRFQFPNATPGPKPGTFLVGVSTAVVSQAGTATIPPFPIRTSLIRTGPIQAGSPRPGAAVLLEFAGGMGRFNFYSPDGTMSTGDGHNTVFKYRTQSVLSPFCNIGEIDGTNQSNAGTHQVNMPSVDIAEFAGVSGSGAITAGEVTKGWSFVCEGSSATTRPSVTVTTGFPGNDVGVGLPVENSPIGIQILMNGAPVQLGTVYPDWAWTSDLANSIFSGMSDDNGATWRPSGAGGRSDTIIPISFRYYKNGPALEPGAFNVMFTLTMEIF